MSSAQTMKIFSIINRIKQELEESPRAKLGGPGKRLVEIDRLLDLLEDLKVVIPEDIRRATGIISEADNTIRDAKDTAAEIVEQAHQEADTVVSQAQSAADNLRSQAQTEFESRVCEAEVYKEAYTRASKVSAEAEENATAIYNGARKYADDILGDLQRYLAEYHHMIDENRRELGVGAENAQAPVIQPQQNEAQPYQDQRFQEPPAQYAAPQAAPQAAPPQAAPQTARQPRAPYGGDERHAVEPDPTATKQFARPERKPEREEVYEEEPPRRRENREPEQPQKRKGLFKRILEAEDEDDEFDDEDDAWGEEPPRAGRQPEKAKEKKPRKRLIEFIEDDDEDEDEDY